MTQKNVFLESLYSKASAPEIVKDFIDRLAILAEEDTDIAFYVDAISMKFEEYLKLIEETEENINPFVAEMEVHAQNLKNKFKANGLNHFEQKMRRKALISIIHKMNRNLRSGKSIESINDLIGMEITLHTPTEHDTQQSIDELRKAVALTFEYFANSQEHKGSKFSLCDSDGVKDAMSVEHTEKEVKLVRKLNPHIFLPSETLVEQKFLNYGKDYVFRPKLTTAYQGVQFVVKSDKGIYFEIQLKTQPMRDYLDVEDSPGNHKNHKREQAVAGVETPQSAFQFDVDFDENKMNHIYGFRKEPKFDRSGILQAIKWDLRKSTHPNF